MALSVALLAFVATAWGGLGALARADWRPLALAAPLSLALVVGLGGLKWWLCARLLGVDAPLRQVLALWAGLLPASFFMPFQSGHALNALALAGARGVPMIRAVETVALDKASTLAGTCLLVLAGQPLLPEAHPLRHAGVTLVAAAGVAALLLAGPALRWLRRVPALARHLRLVQAPPRLAARAGLLAVSAVYQTSEVLALLFAARALGADLPPALALGVQPAVILAAYVPVTWMGFGVREGLLALLLAGAVSRDDAVAAGLLVDLLEYVAPAVAGLVALPTALRALAAYTASKKRSPRDAIATSAGAGR